MAVLAGCGKTQPTTVMQPTTAPTTQRPTTAPTTIPTIPPTIPTMPTTAPTVPTTVPTQPEEPANPVPEELRNNYYLGHKGHGACEKMTGNITVLVVFVSDTLNAWSEYDMEQAKPALQECETRLEAAAAAYGAELDLTMEYVEAKISMEFKVDENVLTSAYTVMRKMGIGDAFHDQDSLEEKYEADAVPMLFVLNRQGRAFATTMDAETDVLECAVIYGKDMSSIRHELCHIFGALDFYFPDETIAAQERYLPDSIMNNHFTEVDDLTAYLIGWVDELSQNAINFLRATNHLTKEMIEEAQEQN
jgi:hypothetical protein